VAISDICPVTPRIGKVGLREGEKYFDILFEDNKSALTNAISTASSLFPSACTAGAPTAKRAWDFPFAAGSLRGIMGALRQKHAWNRNNIYYHPALEMT
jgi:hypothetical protein